MTFAYCYASGLIEFGSRLPGGALPLIKGRDKAVRELLESTARHGYRTRLIDDRATKIPGTDCLIVPGIPEAENEFVALDALRAFLDWIGPQARKAGLEVLP